MTGIEIVRNDDAQPVFTLLDEMIVERGTREDWEALHHLHYKSEGKPVGAQYWRLSLHGVTIGVVALTLPRPLLKERNALMKWYKPGRDTKLSNTQRYKWVNGHVRVVGRIVLDTMFRGVGASYRLQNLVSRMSGRELVEIQSAMAKYNLFAQRAGFRFVKPMRSNCYAKGIRFFRETYESHPADTVALLQEIEAMSPAVQKMTLRETRKFYYDNSAMEKTGSARDTGLARVEGLPVPELIRQLQQLVLGSPLYGAYVNPDYRRELPESLPLRAFDWQGVNDPLKLENL